MCIVAQVAQGAACARHQRCVPHYRMVGAPGLMNRLPVFSTMDVALARVQDAGECCG